MTADEAPQLRPRAFMQRGAMLVALALLALSSGELGQPARRRAAVALLPPPLPRRVSTAVERELGAFLQTSGRHLRSTSRVLETLRSFYPSSTVVLFLDGGSAEVERELRGIARAQRVQHFFAGPRRGAGVLNNFGLKGEANAAAAFGWFSRVLNASLLIEQSHFFYMEDDVVVVNRTDVLRLCCDLNGQAEDLSLADEVEDYVRRMNPFLKGRAGTRGLPFSGFGATVWRTQFWRDVAAGAPEAVENDMASYGTLDNMESDRLATFVAYLRNGTVGPWEGHTEPTHRDFSDKMARGVVQVIHNMKDLY